MSPHLCTKQHLADPCPLIEHCLNALDAILCERQTSSTWPVVYLQRHLTVTSGLTTRGHYGNVYNTATFFTLYP